MINLLIVFFLKRPTLGLYSKAFIIITIYNIFKYLQYNNFKSSTFKCVCVWGGGGGGGYSSCLISQILVHMVIWLKYNDALLINWSKLD